MPRVRSNVQRLKRKKKIMKAAKGARGGRSKLYSPPKRPSSEAFVTNIVIVATRSAISGDCGSSGSMQLLTNMTLRTAG